MTATTGSSGAPDTQLKVIRRRQVVRASHTSHSHRSKTSPSSWWDLLASPPATLWALCSTVLSLLVSPLHKLAVGRYPDRLHDFHEIPPFLRENPHILTNYRVHFRKRDCVRSMCRCHNETLNIFTHSCGFALLGLLGYRTWVWLEQQHSSSGDELAFALYFISVLYCMAASTAYHTFGCHSMTMFRSLLTHDICGVFVTIAVLELEISYFLFHDHWGWMVFYWIFSLTGLTIIFPVIYNFSMLNFDTLSKVEDPADTDSDGDAAKGTNAAPETHAVAKNADNYRMTCLVGITIALAQVAFMAFHVWFTKGFDSVYLQHAAWHVAQGVCAMAFGVLFFAKRFPESSYPGQFDVVGHSHQIWHVAAVINLWEAYNCITQLYLYKQHSLAVA